MIYDGSSLSKNFQKFDFVLFVFANINPWTGLLNRIVFDVFDSFYGTRKFEVFGRNCIRVTKPIVRSA